MQLQSGHAFHPSSRLQSKPSSSWNLLHSKAAFLPRETGAQLEPEKQQRVGHWTAPSSRFSFKNYSFKDKPWSFKKCMDFSWIHYQCVCWGQTGVQCTPEHEPMCQKDTEDALGVVCSIHWREMKGVQVNQEGNENKLSQTIIGSSIVRRSQLIISNNK